MKLPFEGKNRVTRGWGSAHYGLDIVGDNNKTVRALMGGTVGASTIITNKLNKTWEWGNYVRIDGDDGLKYYYCHLSSRAVHSGQRVEVGAPLGIMGNTGKSFGAHLHLQIRDKAKREQNVAVILGIPNKLGTYIESSAQAPSAKLVSLRVGPVSKGDRAALETLAKEMDVPCVISTIGCKAGLCLCTIGAVSSGDRARVEALAAKQNVACGVVK